MDAALKTATVELTPSLEHDTSALRRYTSWTLGARYLPRPTCAQNDCPKCRHYWCSCRSSLSRRRNSLHSIANLNLTPQSRPKFSRSARTCGYFSALAGCGPIGRQQYCTEITRACLYGIDGVSVTMLGIGTMRETFLRELICPCTLRN